MKPHPRSRRGEQGFALIGAIFILVVLTSAGASMLRIHSAGLRSTSMALIGARTYYGAHSGIEWAIYEVVNSGGCPAATFTLGEAGAAGLDVIVSCSSSSHVEGASSKNVLVIESTATYGNFGDRDYVSRALNVTMVL